MTGLNRVILAGRLIVDPEIRYTSDEQAVANFTIGVSHGSKTDPVKCVANGGLAKIAGEYLKKGRLVAVEGRISVREWKNKNGMKLSQVEIVIEEMQMLDPKFHNAKEKAKDVD